MQFEREDYVRQLMERRGNGLDGIVTVGLIPFLLEPSILDGAFVRKKPALSEAKGKLEDSL